MKFIKGTKELPTDKHVIARYMGNIGLAIRYREKIAFRHNQGTTLWSPEHEELQNLEWLDESENSTIDNECRVNAEYLCTFASFDQWVNKASSWIGGHRKGTIICIDKAGNLCLIGEDFMAARDFGLFPVKAYRMIKTIEAV